MEDLNLPEEHEELNQEQFDEVLKSDLIECPNCKGLEKFVFETLRVSGQNKVKPIEFMGCKNCGNVFCDVNKLNDII
jgi:uncharacterized Zn finger protein